MGKPKFSRKKYVTPSHPWQEDRIKAENELKRKYGLKNKREIWKAETALRRYRGQARTLLAKTSTDPQAKRESDQLLTHLTRMNILPPNSNLDDVLSLENESILGRRLQTLTYLKGLANTPDHARQLICHGHITIANTKITVPSYMVTKEEENDIAYTYNSVLNDTMHPARPRADHKSSPIRRDRVEQPKVDKPVETPVKDKKLEESKPTDETSEKSKEETKPEEPPKEETVEKPINEEKVEETKEKPKEETKTETPKEEVEQKVEETKKEKKVEEDKGGK